jgi:hypothetical protein
MRFNEFDPRWRELSQTLISTCRYATSTTLTASLPQSVRCTKSSTKPMRQPGCSAPRWKVLHRKRPDTLVLHDTWVRSCYVGSEPNARVPRAERRSWAEYMSLISIAIGRDLRVQRHLFDRLGAAASGHGKISDLRLLDILAWMSKGEPPSDAAAD